MGQFDVVVIGAGHAGCEAALASARMGLKTLILSINLEAVANMFCNPAIGGTGKGHLVREIDALGGQMGICIDKTFIQSKMLNMSKGPAVHSLRAQADKRRYHEEMKRTLELQENLLLRQGEVIDIDMDKEGGVKGVILKTGAYYSCKAAVIATGTFLGGKIFIGDSCFESGPNGLAPSTELAEALKKRGMKLRRFKTGTPARALSASLDYSKMERQDGDEVPVPFSFMDEDVQRPQVPCWLTYTNERTHKIIRDNFSRSALFSAAMAPCRYSSASGSISVKAALSITPDAKARAIPRIFSLFLPKKMTSPAPIMVASPASSAIKRAAPEEPSNIKPPDVFSQKLV